MNNTVKNVLIFGGGVATGAVATYFYIKDKFEQYVQEEVDSVKEHYKKKVEENKNDTEEVEDEEEPKFTQKEKEEYKSMVKESGYVNYSNYMNQDDREESKSNMRTPEEDPYVIQPEEYGEELGYDTQTLTYFADKVLVDDLDDVVEDPETVVGTENLKIFDEFGASSIYIRNDIFKMDYEIIKDDFNWADMQDPIDIEAAKEMQHERFVERTSAEADREKKPHEL